MTMPLPSAPKIPCRAKDPHTCKYHGAELKAAEALDAGDINAYLVAQVEMAAALKTTPEVVDYFNQIATPTQALPVQQPAKNDHYAPAAASFEERFDTALKEYDYAIVGISDDNPKYTVGGHPNSLTYEPSTAERRAYQRAAEIIIKNSSHPDARYYTPGMRVISDASAVRQALQQAANQAAGRGTPNLAAAYTGIIRDNINKTGIPGGNFIDTREALQKLDDAYYWQPTGYAAEAQLKIEHANMTRVLRIEDHLENGKPYLVGGTEQDVAEAQFTAARLVYQRAANTLFSATRRKKGAPALVVGEEAFEHAWRTMEDRTLDSAILDEIQPAGDLDETKRTLDQVYTVLSSKFIAGPGGKAASLPQALRTLDHAYWNSPNGPVANRQ